jgi:hypothetical protein
LTNLGVQFSNDLIVQVSGPTGKVIRAFVTNATVDLDPGSELAVRLVLEQIAAIPGATLSQFTLKEVNEIATSLKLLSTVKQFTGGANLETTISTIRNAVVADPNLMAFIAAAATAGQTTLGPGDVGNYFPFTQGNVWTFQGTHTETGHSIINFQNTLTISGTQLIGGINATVESESNPDGSETPIDDYVTKETAGITNHGNTDLTDFITPHVIPFQEVQFPLQAGASFQPVNKSGLDYGQDLDGDGTNETFAVTSRVTVIDFETVAVSAGSFQNTARIESELTVTVILSKSGSKVTATGSATTWLAPGIGPIKRQNVIQSQGVSETTSEELVSYLVNGQGVGAVPITIATGVTQANSDTTNPGPSGIASDGTNYLVVFCQDLGASPGLFGAFITDGVTGPPFPIAPRTCASNVGIGVAFDGTNYLVVFSNNGTIGGVRVSTSGSILDGSGGFAISTGAPSITNFDPTVAFDGSNYLVAWQKFNGNYDIYGARVTPNGQVLGEFPIFTATGEQVFPSLAFDGTNYLVVWNDTRSGSGPSTDTHIYGTRVSTGDSVLDPAGIAIATAPGPQGGATLAFDGTNYLVVWSVPSATFGRRVKPDGSLLDGPADSSGIPINTKSSGGTVVFDGTNYLVTWIVGNFPTNPPAGVYGAKVSTGGQVVDGQPDTLGILLNGPPQNNDALFGSLVAYSTHSSTLLTWTNNRELAGTTKSIQGLLLFH